MRSPSLLVATDTFLPERNGAAIVTSRLAHGLLQRGWAVHVVAPAVPGATDPVGALSIDRVPSIGLPFYGSVRIARSADRPVRLAFDRARPDVVLCATEFRIGHLAQVAAIARGIPLASTYHTDFEQYATAYRSRFVARPVRAWLTRFHRRSDLVFAPSAVACRALESMGVPGPIVWGRCVDTSVFHPMRRSDEVRSTHGFRDHVTLLCVARLAREKSVDLVIAAYLRAIATLPRDRTRLVIVGDGPLETALRAQAAQGLAAQGARPDHIRFLGARDRDRELPAIYASADAFVFASTTETLGLVVLEAMASGLPIIAPRVGGIADHVVHDVNGIDAGTELVDGLSRGIVRLVLRPEDRAQLGFAARRSAEAVDERTELDALDQQLRRLCAGRAAAAA
jgi:phosphatidylinositol alpha 1,6-mannosyltransferase